MKLSELNKIINKSDLHRDIIRFFHENPASIDTLRGISTWVRGDHAEVRDVLEDLVSSGILISHKASSTTGYSYTRDIKITSLIKKKFKS